MKRVYYMKFSDYRRKKKKRVYEVHWRALTCILPEVVNENITRREVPTFCVYFIWNNEEKKKNNAKNLIRFFLQKLILNIYKCFL